MSDRAPVRMPPVAPYLTVSDGQAAVEFYKAAFGANELFRQLADDGQRLLHCSLELNGGHVMLSDEFPEWGTGGCTAPTRLNGTSVTIHLEVDDADALWRRALDAGCEVIMPLADMFWGARYGKLRDPFGHVWSLGSPQMVNEGAPP